MSPFFAYGEGRASREVLIVHRSTHTNRSQAKPKTQHTMATKKQHQQEKQFCFIFFVLMLVVMLACNSTTAFSSIQVAAPWGTATTMPSWESWGATSWSATTKAEGQATSTTLFGWSVPSSVWALDADPTARKVVYYDE